MAAIRRFDPPAFMTDLDRIPDGRAQWDEFIDKVFKYVLDTEEKRYAAGGHKQPLQYFNTKAYAGDLIEQPILWNAFPKTMSLNLGRDRALIEADRLIPLAPINTFPSYPNSKSDPSSKFNHGFDPTLPSNADLISKATFWTRQNDEYCEWHVEREPVSGQIKRVTFTSEPPEYWQAIFGATIDLGDGMSFTFRGDPKVAADIYGELLGRMIDPNDLRAPFDREDAKKGEYDFYNKWNTTLGIVHLCCPPNSIAAEIQLGGDATVLYERANGVLVTNPDELIGRADYGGPNRNSDPTIGATVNALARAGAMITLVNPIGLYMDNIDLAGWELPDGINPQDCVKTVRGGPGMIERLVVEVPPETGRYVSDIRIGGEPVRYGGQIAECITIKLTGGAYGIGSVHNTPIYGGAAPFLRPTNPSIIYEGPPNAPVPGLERAFVSSATSLGRSVDFEALTVAEKWQRAPHPRGVR